MFIGMSSVNRGKITSTNSTHPTPQIAKQIPAQHTPQTPLSQSDLVLEPAAFLIQTLRAGHSEALHITKPPSFNLKPENLSESNFGYWVKVFGATDVSAPPSLFRTVSTDYSAGGGDSSTDYTHSAQLAIEEGYRAIYASAGVAWNQWNGDAAVDVVIGRRGHRIKDDGSWFWTTNLDNEEASIPIALTSFRMSDMSVAIEIKCQRTDRAIRKWPLAVMSRFRWLKSTVKRLAGGTWLIQHFRGLQARKRNKT